MEEQKRSFLRVVSHQLRTPLNSIIGFSEILATELYGPLGAPQYREYAEIIRNSGEKLLKLVNQVVEIARLQAGDLEIALAPEPIGPLVEDLTEKLAPELAGRDLRLVVECCDDAVALADPRALDAVLSNLLQNALAFSPEGGVIHVAVTSPGDRLQILVENGGDGVETADLERLTRPFEQGENALTRHGEGAGLGLAICELTCQAMGAQLVLASGRGQGFRAYVLLPTA